MESTHQKRLDPMVHLLSDLHGPLLTKAYDRGNTSHLRLRLVSKLWKSRIDDLFLSDIPIRLNKNILSKGPSLVSTKFLRLMINLKDIFPGRLETWLKTNQRFILNLRALKITMFDGESICGHLLTVCTGLEEIEIQSSRLYFGSGSHDLTQLTKLTSLLISNQPLDRIPDLPNLQILRCRLLRRKINHQTMPFLPKLRCLTLCDYSSDFGNDVLKRLTTLTELQLFLDPTFSMGHKVIFDLRCLTDLKYLKIPWKSYVGIPNFKFLSSPPSLEMLVINQSCTFDPAFPIQMFSNLKFLQLDVPSSESLGLESWETKDTLHLKKITIEIKATNDQRKAIKKKLSLLMKDAEIAVQDMKDKELFL